MDRPTDTRSTMTVAVMTDGTTAGTAAAATGTDGPLRRRLDGGFRHEAEIGWGDSLTNELARRPGYLPTIRG